MSVLEKLKLRKKPVSVETVDEDGVIERTDIEGSRSMPSVNKGLSIQARGLHYVIIACIVIIAGFVLYKYYKNFFEKQKEATATTVITKNAQASVGIQPLTKPALIDIDPPAAPPPGVGAPNAATPGAAVQTGAGQYAGNVNDPNYKPVLSPKEEAKERKMSSSVKFKIARKEGNTEAAPPAAQNEKPDSGPFPQLLSGVQALLIPDRNLFMTKGTILDCVLDQAIDSSIGGHVSCQLSIDGKSASGAVTLLEKGTKIVGEYKGDIKGSTGRLYVIWERAETPSGVVIGLDSSGMDSLGRAGIDGHVNTHFMDKFAAGILISIIGDASATLTQKGSVSGSDNQVSYTTTATGFSNMAQEAARHNADIPNTLQRNQGAVIKIFVQKDLDFRSVYSLEGKE